MRNFITKIQNEAMLRAAHVRTEEGASSLLENLGLIILAVVLLILFREQLVGLFTSALENTTTQINNLFSSATTPTPSP